MIEAACACRAIQFCCDTEPFFTQYCHCNKCREIAALADRAADKQGYAWTGGYLASSLLIRSGQDKLEALIRNQSKLLLCKDCHCLIYGISLEPSKQTGIGVNMYNFQLPAPIPEAYKPVRHVCYADRLLDVADHLPKFSDLPLEQFGSGTIWDGERLIGKTL